MILIDSNSICHMAKHSLDSLSWEEKKVGVIFGFLRQLLSLSKTCGENQFVFVWDASSSTKRMDIFPDYKKARRKEKTIDEKQLDDITYSQFTEVRKYVLPKLGFKNNFKVDGFEADDLIAKICLKYPKKQITIISTDEDLYQLLSDNVSLYSIRKKQFYTKEHLWKEYKITPDKWGEVKAIAGCSTDGVPGIPNVGEITACKYITKKLSPKLKSYRAIKDSSHIIERNKKLVVLPFEGTPDIQIDPDGPLQLSCFINICQQYGFYSLMNEKSLPDWKKHIFTK